MAGQTFGDLINKWDQLASAVEVNALPLLQAEREQLQAVVLKARELSKRQDAERAVSQQTTKELVAAMTSGRELSLRLRNAVRGFLGARNEKLVEYGLQPQRRRTRSKEGGETKKAPKDAGLNSAAE